MKRFWSLMTIGISLALVGPGVAADKTTPSGVEVAQVPYCPPPPNCPPGYLPGQIMPSQPGVTPPPANVTPPRTTPPSTQPGTTPPAVPPVTTPTPSPISQAPSTESFAQAPAAGTVGGESFNPNMIGDLGAGSFIAGWVPTTNYGYTTQRTFRGPNGQGFLATTQQLTNGQVVSQTVVPFQFTGSGSTVVTPFAQKGARVALIPQAGRGAFKIAENESPRPTDRFFTTYNYFNGQGSGIPGLPTFDTHREVFGFEKTFMDGDASVGLRVNTLQNTGDGSLGADYFGDMTIVTKYAFLNDRETGNVISGGVLITVPTGPDAILVDGSRLNPTVIQPWNGGILNFENFFVQGFSSVAIPTDGRDAWLGISDLGLGWKMFRAADPTSIISYVVPTTEAHFTFAYNRAGVNRWPVGYPTALTVLTNGVHIGLGQSTDFTLAVAVPVSGPKTFDIEGVAQLNWRFGASAGRNRAYTPAFVGN